MRTPPTILENEFRTSSLIIVLIALAVITGCGRSQEGSATESRQSPANAATINKEALSKPNAVTLAPNSGLLTDLSLLPLELRELEFPAGRACKIVRVSQFSVEETKRVKTENIDTRSFQERSRDRLFPSQDNDGSQTKFTFTIHYEKLSGDKSLGDWKTPDAASILFVTAAASLGAPENSFDGPSGIARIWCKSPSAGIIGHNRGRAITAGIVQLSVLSVSSNTVAVSGTINDVPLKDVTPPVFVLVLFSGNEPISKPVWLSITSGN